MVHYSSSMRDATESFLPNTFENEFRSTRSFSVSSSSSSQWLQSIAKFSPFRRPAKQINPIPFEQLEHFISPTLTPAIPALTRHRSESQQMVMDNGILGHTFQMLQIPELCIVRRVATKWYTISKQMHTMNTQILSPSNIQNIPHSSIANIRALDCLQCYSITDSIVSNSIVSFQLLTHLKLNGQWSNITDEGLSSLHLLPSLTHLELDTCVNTSERGIYYLSQIKHLQTLQITNNMQQWNFHSLRFLTNLSHTLKILVLRSTQFNTRIACTYLATLSSLTYLELHRLDLTAADIDGISQIASLHTLHIAHNHTLLDQHIISLNHSSSLRVLKFQNTVGFTDGLFFHLSSNLLNALTSLHIMECRITDTAVTQMYNVGMKQLTILELSYCGGITDQCMHSLHFPLLTTLSLRGCQQITGITMQELRDTNIEILDISYTNIRDLGIHHISYLFQLTSLSMSHLCLSNVSLYRVRKLANLTYLDIGGSDMFTVKGLSYLLSLRKLDTLLLNECRQLNRGNYSSFSSNAFDRLAQLMPRTFVLQHESLHEYHQIAAEAEEAEEDMNVPFGMESNQLECCNPCQTAQSMCVIC